MEAHLGETQNIKRYVFRTDSNLTTAAQRSGNTASNRYQDYVWQKPKDITKVYITAIGAGGSGGPGGSGDVDGWGGGSGTVSHLLIDADQIPNQLTIRVGFGGDVNYAPNTLVQLIQGATVSTVYTHPNNSMTALDYVANIPVYAGVKYKFEAWGAGGGGAGFNIYPYNSGYTYGGGGGGYASITDFIPSSNGVVTVRIPSRNGGYYNNGPDTVVTYSDGTLSNVELLFAGGGKVGMTGLSGVAAPGAGGSGRANSSFVGTTYTSKGGNATFLAVTDPTNNYRWGSGGGGAGGPLANVSNDSTSRDGGPSQINATTGGLGALSTGFNGGSATVAADGFGGAGGGASAGVNQTSTTTGSYGGNGSFPGGGGGTGFYWRSRGNGGAGASGCVKLTTDTTVQDVTPGFYTTYNNGANTVVFCGDPSSNVVLLKALGGYSGLYKINGYSANGATARAESRGARTGLSAFYSGAPIANATVSTFLTNSIVSSGVYGNSNYSSAIFATTTNTSPSSSETYQSMIESISPLFSSGGFGAQKALATGGSGGFGSGGGGGIGTRNTYPYGGSGGKGGAGIVIITCW